MNEPLFNSLVIEPKTSIATQVLSQTADLDRFFHATSDGIKATWSPHSVECVVDFCKAVELQQSMLPSPRAHRFADRVSFAAKVVKSDSTFSLQVLATLRDAAFEAMFLMQQENTPESLLRAMTERTSVGYRYATVQRVHAEAYLFAGNLDEVEN